MDQSMRELAKALSASSFECAGELVKPGNDKTGKREPSLPPMVYDLPTRVDETPRRVARGYEPSSGAIGDNEATPPSTKLRNKVRAGQKRGRREVSVSDDETERAPDLDGGVIDIKNILPPNTKRRATANNYTPGSVSKALRSSTRSTRKKIAQMEYWGKVYNHQHCDNDNEEVPLPSSPPSAAKLPAIGRTFEYSNNKKGRATSASASASATTNNQGGDFSAAKAYMQELAGDPDKPKSRLHQLKFLNHFLNIRRGRVQRELERQREDLNELIEEQHTAGLAMTELQKLLLPPPLVAAEATSFGTPAPAVAGPK
ncbi:hypothetical protein DV737_g5369, partial [Chaetothyriales sp. CBS 132003]